MKLNVLLENTVITKTFALYCGDDVDGSAMEKFAAYADDMGVDEKQLSKVKVTVGNKKDIDPKNLVGLEYDVILKITGEQEDVDEVLTDLNLEPSDW